MKKKANLLKFDENIKINFFTESNGVEQMHIAECVDFDFLAQGKTAEIAKNNLVKTLKGQIYLNSIYK